MRSKKSNKILIKSANLFTNKYGAEVIRVVFPYSPAYLEEIRNIDGRKWNPTDRYWTVPLTVKNYTLLLKLGYKIQTELYQWYVSIKTKTNKQNNNEIETKLNTLPYKLKDYQIDGTKGIDLFNGCALLADEMGLGKTIQAIAYLHIFTIERPAIIVCPAFLKYNWKYELNKWLPDENVTMVNGLYKPGTELSGIIIVNYDILTNEKTQAVDKTGEPIFLKSGKPKMIDVEYTGWVDHIRKTNPKILVIDEIHNLQNEKTKKTKAVIRMAQYIPKKIGISGTPIMGKPRSIYNSINIINPNLFPNKWKFLHRYCGPKNNGFGWVFNGISNGEELHRILIENIMIRRLKQDVWKNAPEKIHTIVRLDISNRQVYERAEKDFVEYLQSKVNIKLRRLMKNVIMEEHEGEVFEINDHKLDRLHQETAKKANPLHQMTTLKMIAAKGKIKQVIDWIDNFLESGEKLVCFCNHLFVIEAIEKKFGKICVAISGHTSITKRHEYVQEFQNNPKIRLFIGNEAAEEGLTLTAACNIANIEYPWHPNKLFQRIDRVHRITQERTVNIWHLIAINTIEQRIIEVLEQKQIINDMILDGRKSENVDIFEELINSYTNEK